MPHIAEEERVVVPKAASAYRAPRPAAKRYAQRYRKPRHAPQRPRQRREGDFLERQGYIY
jgi:hypothetical protein